MTTPATPFGSGVTVLDIASIRVGLNKRLFLVGNGSGLEQVIIRVGGACISVGDNDVCPSDCATIYLAQDARIELMGGLTPEQVIFVTDGCVSLRQSSMLFGTVLGGTNTVFAGDQIYVEGALMSRLNVKVMQSGTVTLRSFVGW